MADKNQDRDNTERDDFRDDLDLQDEVETEGKGKPAKGGKSGAETEEDIPPESFIKPEAEAPGYHPEEYKNPGPDELPEPAEGSRHDEPWHEDPYLANISEPVLPIEEDNFADAGERLGIDEESAVDFSAIESTTSNAEDIFKDQIAEYTEDEDILDDFRERQGLAISGSGRMLDELEEHNSLTPQLSGDDLDAAWDQADQSGEETVGGTTPTPDQDIVDELGEAVGLTYDDGEELHTEDKLAGRDRKRWELDPRSGDPGEGEEEIPPEQN